MKVSKNFHLHEFLYPEIFEIPGILPIWFLDHRLFKIAQTIRNRFSRPMTINDWCESGSYTLSGLRPFNTTIGAKLSQHKFGRAADIHVFDIHPYEVQNIIIDQYLSLSKLGLTTTEIGTPTWTHIDTRWTGLQTLNKIILE